MTTKNELFKEVGDAILNGTIDYITMKEGKEGEKASYYIQIAPGFICCIDKDGHAAIKLFGYKNMLGKNVKRSLLTKMAQERRAEIEAREPKPIKTAPAKTRNWFQRLFGKE